MTDKELDEYLKNHRIREIHRIEQLPVPLRELQELSSKTVTIWSWMYPWNHCYQPPQFKDTLTLMGDGFVEVRFHFDQEAVTYTVLEKLGSFLSERRPQWDAVKVGQTLSHKEMKELCNHLV